MREERGKWAFDENPKAVTKLNSDFEGFEPSTLELLPSSG